jgi:hypothetical protein
MTPDVETATKEPLSFNNHFTTFYETVVGEHTMFYHPLRHDVN